MNVKFVAKISPCFSEREQDTVLIMGFETKRPPSDTTVARLRQKNGLPNDASLAEIEPVAVALLEDARTALDAA